MLRNAGKITAVLMAGIMAATPLTNVLTVYADDELAAEILVEGPGSDAGDMYAEDIQETDGEEPEYDGDPAVVTPWDALSKEFHPFYKMSDPDDREEAEEKITTAYLKDSVEGGLDDETGLVEAESYEVLSITPSEQDKMITVEITAKDLVAHHNGQGDLGHWLGVALPKISLPGYTITYSPTLAVKTPAQLETREFHDYITSEYKDDDNNVTHITSYISLEQLDANDQDNYLIYLKFDPDDASKPIEYYAYNIVFSDVTRYPWSALAKDKYAYYNMGTTGAEADGKITTAYLKDDVEGGKDDKTGLVKANSYKVLSVTPDEETGIITVEITAKDLAAHHNGQGDLGFWLGVALPKISVDGYTITYSPTLTVKTPEELKTRTFRDGITSEYRDGNNKVTHITSYISLEQLDTNHQDYYLIYLRCHPDDAADNESDVYYAYKIVFKDITRVIPLASIDLGGDKEVTRGKTYTFEPEVSPEENSDVLIWSSSNEDVATIDQNGKATALKNGFTMITAKSTLNSDVKDTVKLTVNPIAIEDIDLDTPRVTLAIGETYTFTAELTPEDNDDEIEWTIDDTSVATVDQEGKVTGKTAGKTWVTAASTLDPTVTDKARVTVREPIPIEEITLAPKSETITVGSTLTIKAAVTPEDNDDELIWKSSDKKVATVDQNGKVTAVAAGTAKITATSKLDGEVSAEATITVKAKQQKKTQVITASDQSKKVTDKPFNLGAKTNGDGKLTYTSSDTNVVTVNESGLVTIKGVGSAYITITASSTDEYKLAMKTVRITVTSSTSKKDISKAEVTGCDDKRYTGKPIKQDPTVKLNGEKLLRGRDYKVVYVTKDRTNVGEVKIKIEGMGDYKNSKTLKFRIKKAVNKMEASGKTVTVKNKEIKKKKSKEISAKNAFKIKNNIGKVTYKKTRGLQKIEVAKNGKVTIKKGVKVGAHVVRVLVTDPGDKNHKTKSKYVDLVIVVK